MDPAIVLTTLGSQPASIDRSTAMVRGELLPVLIPLAALPPSTLATWLLPHGEIDIAQRVSAALDAGLEQQAWSLVARQTTPLVGRLELVLSLWNAHELARLKLPGSSNNWLQVVGANPTTAIESDASLALDAVHEMLATIGWPRWSGPLLVVAGGAGAADPYPGVDEIVRPALPMLRYRSQAPGVTPCEDLAARLSTLTLTLTAPPAIGWPAWLRIGLEEVAKAKARGEGPSPLKMLAVRQRAGTDALAHLLVAADPDRALCEALCAPLVHTKRRPHLPSFLDLLRQHVEVQGALRLAYDLSLDQLVTDR